MIHHANFMRDRLLTQVRKAVLSWNKFSEVTRYDQDCAVIGRLVKAEAHATIDGYRVVIEIAVVPPDDPQEEE